MKKYLLPCAIIVAVIGFDQGLKFWVKGNMDDSYSRNLPQDIPMAGEWFHLHFVENNGMAFGLEFGGDDKDVLRLKDSTEVKGVLLPGKDTSYVRLRLPEGFVNSYHRSEIKEVMPGENWGKLLLTIFRILAVCFGFWYLTRQIAKRAHTGFIVCVALIIAGAVGNIIDSVFYGLWFADINSYLAGIFEGQVVDMLYFPIIEAHFPAWFPVWGGEPFTFFSPVFNIADAAISVGVLTLVLFQNRFFKKTTVDAVSASQESEATPGPADASEQE